jgi:hypothetical protein
MGVVFSRRGWLWMIEGMGSVTWDWDRLGRGGGGRHVGVGVLRGVWEWLGCDGVDWEAT